MKNTVLTLFTCSMASFAAADDAMLALQADGPWIDLPEGMLVNTAAPTIADIVALANLDDDPLVISAQEAEMIAVLSQVLAIAPVAE